jgi:ubiquinone/menaquinone biosynthesis C-methylase UbiE
MSFDRLAPFYQTMEWVAAGGKLQRCRTAFLDEIPVPRRILLAGEGHGRSLPLFVEKFPEAKIVVVDFSAKMLEIAKSKVDSERVTFLHADLLEWEGPQGKFDLIVTNFFLDCFIEEDLASVVSKLGKLAAPRADWLLADFDIPPTPLAGLRSRVIVGVLYKFFRVACGLRTRELVPPDGEITKAGFSRMKRETYEWGLLKSEWWARQ